MAGNGSDQNDPSGYNDPLKLPEFESGALHLAQQTAEPKTQTGTATAKPKTSGHGHSSLAAAATNPIANLMQFQFQNSFVPESYDSSGYSNSFVIQPVIPFSLPDNDVFDFAVTRTTLPVLSTPDFDGPAGAKTGLGDLVSLGFLVHEQKFGSMKGMLAAGIATTLPTATSDETGAGKWQLGPGALAFFSVTKSLQTGIMAYHQWDIVGDSGRPGVSKTFFQPILNYHFDNLFGQKGWYVGMQDILWNYDWKKGKLDLPIGVRLGRVFKAGKMPLNVFIEPFGRPVHNGPTGMYGVKLNVTFLFPE